MNRDGRSGGGGGGGGRAAAAAAGAGVGAGAGAGALSPKQTPMSGVCLVTLMIPPLIEP